jgi:hypothetical protein
LLITHADIIANAILDPLYIAPLGTSTGSDRLSDYDPDAIILFNHAQI